ncbi:TetR/AcrR family transcriptional regulator [Actinacidiphila sp. DG2A-62]|uniref:TetR/AcrR family transcriptional regulator n=1 Tax=Actinacidiphila sp. DG2A-62 TaxID=3108821 RepID=UPI002DB615A5|nr:TetR/AcrR family transcriptional regulator [Actinacidiphila sp. DG2A-62]MEC3993774.1 TetR/AcrR family transcriptional regulator [Actinacidiphila sp. DG2A-62]
MGDEVPDKRTRRRGEVLDRALLSAAWEELLEKGYENLSLESVAERAGTSRPVLARRWNDRRELVLAAIRHWLEQNRPALPDTGTLRGDLLAYLEEKRGTRSEMATVFQTRLAAFAKESGTSPQTLITLMAGNLDEIWEAAVERGEVDRESLTPRIRSLPFDLFTVEITRTMGPVPSATLEEIVDTIILPLATAGRTGPGARPAGRG